jgi:two-component system sensor histidine kinase KdpD
VTTTAESGTLDVHLVTHERTARRNRALLHWLRGGRSSALSRGRRMAGLAVAVGGLPLFTVLLQQFAGDASLATDLVFFLLLVVAVALLGGMLPALLAAVGAFLLLNYFFTPPLRLFTIAERENLVALVAFLVVALSLSTVVDASARRTREALRARAEAATLFTLSGSVLRGSRPLHALLEQVRETFALDGVTLLERRDEAGQGPDVERSDDAWHVVASVGTPVSRTPHQGDAEVHVDQRYSLVLAGHPLEADARRVLEAFAAQAAGAVQHERLQEAAASAGSLAEVDRVRTALLSAVSHDLRTPLASAKAAVQTLRSPDLHLSAADETELLETAEGSLDRLAALVENLLDMSRLQAGALALLVQEVDVADVVSGAVASLGPAGAPVGIRLADDLPEVHADPALLERAVANLVQNALRFSPAGTVPCITASAHGERVEIRVTDSGPGVPEDDRDQIFLPFQRLGDHDNSTGVGLGLALSRGLVEAMAGTLTPEDTPGGGLTMTISLPVAPGPAGPDRRTSAPVPAGAHEGTG